MENAKFAVIETGGKQYLVRPGQKILIERIEKPKRGKAITFEKVLLMVEGGLNSRAKDFGARVKLGSPYIDGAKIKGEWIEEKRGEKITHLRYHSKTRRARKKGHRQIYSAVVVDNF
jgi:large subunit ribosomal protein L21